MRQLCDREFWFWKGLLEWMGTGASGSPKMAKHQDCAIPAAGTVLVVLSGAEIAASGTHIPVNGGVERVALDLLCPIWARPCKTHHGSCTESPTKQRGWPAQPDVTENLPGITPVS